MTDFDNDESPIDIGVARQLAYQERNYSPGAYDIIAVPYLLTNLNITNLFRTELRSLAQSLTPGGVLLVLGGSGPCYDDIFSMV